MDGVCAAVISYRPDKSTLQSLLKRLTGQAEQVLLVDNASPNQPELIKLSGSVPRVIKLPQTENLGIGGGINVAWRWARENNFRYLIPFDQDSIPADAMIQRLLEAYKAMRRIGLPVAAIGPQQVNLYNGKAAPFLRFRVPVKKQLWRGDLPHGCVECDFLISSGSLLPVDLLDSVGPMDEALFIDNVDMEWCFRAKRAGYRLYGCFETHMKHKIGERERHIFGLRVRDHNPLRQYYMTRNRISLYLRPDTPRVWIWNDILRFIPKLLYLTLIAERRIENRRMISTALKDARRGRLGKFEVY